MKKSNKHYTCYGTCYCDYTQEEDNSIGMICVWKKCGSIQIFVEQQKIEVDGSYCVKNIWN
jgi:hypothetical protein